MPRLGEVRINDTEYDGDIVIERFDYWQYDEPHWDVPDWEETSLSDLAGPFLDYADAQSALNRAREWAL